jgi:hypothetical protein
MWNHDALEELPMILKKAALFATLLTSAALPALGDEVVLKNGSVLRGIVHEQGEKVVLELEDGKVTLSRSMIKEIRRNEALIKELDDKLQGAVTADEYYQAALWALQRGMETRAHELFTKVISLDPDHGGARRHLGYQKYQGQWLKEDELMAARGFVRHEGRWITDETYQALQEARLKERLAHDKLKLEEELARLRSELARRRLKLEERKLEAVQEGEAQYLYPGWSWGPWNPWTQY